jgi:outer membrane protein insertion porin family
MIKIIINILLLCTLTYAATEVTKISFKQKSIFSRDDLLDIIHSEEDEEFEPRLLKLDKILLHNFFQKNGYLLASVTDSLYFTKNRQELHIRYVIDVGPRYYYAGVRFSGVVEGDTTKLNEAFENIKTGSPFDESKVIAASRLVENVYYNSGKPFVNVKSDYIFEEDSLVFAQISVEENQTVYIKDIDYYGIRIVKKFLIRRELDIAIGDMYNRENLESSQQNIYGTGLFRFVRLEIDPVENEPQSVVLKITVQEKDARWFGVNFGVGHEQSVGNSAEFTLQGGHRNLFGTARSVSLHITPSFLYDFNDNKIKNSQNEIAFKYVEPWIGYTRTPGIFQIAYNQFRLPNSAHFDQFQTSFEVFHKFKNKIETNGTLSAKFITRTNDVAIDTTLFVNIDKDLVKSEIYSISSYTKLDTRPNLFNPTSGSLTDFSVSFSHSISDKKDSQSSLVSQQVNEFFTVVSSWARYQPWRMKIGRKKLEWTLASRIKSGAIFELGKSKFIPISERFYAGGATTVRGYPEQLLGPAETVDEKGKIKNGAGGKLLLLANIEARIPLFWIFVGEIFADAGNVWANLGDYSNQTIRYTTGAGLAILTPLGPVRVDYGYKLNKRKIDADPDAFHLGIYFAF